MMLKALDRKGARECSQCDFCNENPYVCNLRSGPVSQVACDSRSAKWFLSFSLPPKRILFYFHFLLFLKFFWLLLPFFPSFACHLFTGARKEEDDQDVIRFSCSSARLLLFFSFLSALLPNSQKGHERVKLLSKPMKNMSLLWLHHGLSLKHSSS